MLEMISAEKFMLRYLLSNKNERKAILKPDKQEKTEYTPPTVDGELFSTSYAEDVCKIIYEILTYEIYYTFNFNRDIISYDITKKEVSFYLFAGEKPKHYMLCSFYLLLNNEFCKDRIKTNIPELLTPSGWKLSGDGFDEPYKLTGTFDYID